jgi:hypothetical protein
VFGVGVRVSLRFRSYDVYVCARVDKYMLDN